MPLRVARKIGGKLVGRLIAVVEYFNDRAYMNLYLGHLRRLGMTIVGTPRYISPRCRFDGIDYGLIEIHDDVVISEDVRILTHDYAITRAFVALGLGLDEEVYSLRPVVVGPNSFIGMRALLMPGCRIGRNVIVGAGSVVRGDVPDDTIVAGNPALPVGSTLDWGRARLDLLASGALKTGRSRQSRSRVLGT